MLDKFVCVRRSERENTEFSKEENAEKTWKGFSKYFEGIKLILFKK